MNLSFISYVLAVILSLSLTSADNTSLEAEVSDFIESNSNEIIIYSHCISSEKIVHTINSCSAEDSIVIIVDNTSLDYSYSLHNELSERIPLYINCNASLGMSLLMGSNNMIMGNFSLSPDRYNKNTYIMFNDNPSLMNDMQAFLDSLLKHAYMYRGITDTLNANTILKAREQYDKHYVCIRGIVTEIRKSSKSNTYFLKMDNTEFTIVIFADIYKKMKEHSITPMYFLNREVIVKGTFLNHPQYGPEILLSTPDNLNYFK